MDTHATANKMGKNSLLHIVSGGKEIMGLTTSDIISVIVLVITTISCTYFVSEWYKSTKKSKSKQREDNCDKTQSHQTYRTLMGLDTPTFLDTNTATISFIGEERLDADGARYLTQDALNIYSCQNEILWSTCKYEVMRGVYDKIRRKTALGKSNVHISVRDIDDFVENSKRWGKVGLDVQEHRRITLLKMVVKELNPLGYKAKFFDKRWGCFVDISWEKEDE